MKLLLSIAILLGGVACGWFYLLRPAIPANSRFHELVGDRPWRRVGAGICVVLSLMFVLGVYLVDIPDRPMPYAFYWLIMLGLVVWLCVLAFKDAQHTRRVVDRWRAEQEGSVNRGGPNV